MEIFLLPGVEGALWGNEQLTPPPLSNLLKWSPKRSFKQDSGVRGSLRMLRPSQACTPKGGKDTHGYVCTLEGEGHILTELNCSGVRPKPNSAALLTSLLGGCPTSNILPERLQKNLNTGTFSCHLRRKRHFKDTQCGQHFLLL